MSPLAFALRLDKSRIEFQASVLRDEGNRHRASGHMDASRRYFNAAVSARRLADEIDELAQFEEQHGAG